MRWLRWLYHRLGQMFCFAAGGVCLSRSESYGTAAAVAGAALLLVGLGLKALHIWQREIDPYRE